MQFLKRNIRLLSIVGAILLVGILALLLQNHWLPVAKDWMASNQGSSTDKKNQAESVPGHPHSHAASNEPTSLKLSQTASRNIGLQSATATV